MSVNPFRIYPLRGVMDEPKSKSPIQKLGDIARREVANDVFITPLSLAKIQIDLIKSDECDIWMDPFKNNGSYYKQFPESWIVQHQWTEILEGRDFFTYEGHVDIICSNPPFSLINKCLEKFIELSPRVISILVGALNITPRRMEMMEKAGYVQTEFRMASWKPIVGMAVIVQWEKADSLNPWEADELKNNQAYIGRH
tara:strand:- start:39 stop:632 length:594 start_codon:yes stop_codon:yes gene_type:complete